MVARRIIAVSPDQALGQQLATALAGDGRIVDVSPTLDTLEATGAEPALVVTDAGGALPAEAGAALVRLTGSCPVIVVSRRFGVAEVVDLMQSSERVAGVMIAPELDARQLAATATRLLADRIFGLERVMPPGTQIHTVAVGDAEDKAKCMTRIGELLAQSGAPRSAQAAIDQCIDEMLMNALYDAPVDAEGNHIFSGVATRTRVTMRTEHVVAVEYAYDGRQFAVSVRDVFGTLERPTILRFLHKCLHDEQQIDRKAGGAGLGLYLMVNAATEVHFNVLPKIATEAVCIFDLAAPSQQLRGFGFYRQSDPAGMLPAGPAHALPSAATSRARLRRRALQVGGALAAAGLIGLAIVAVPRIFATKKVEPIPTVEVDSQPTGALIEIDGRPFGSTPATVTSLVSGATVSIRFTQRGYRDATVSLAVPRPGEVAKLVHPLETSLDHVRVRFVSNPPGAEIVETGKPPSVDRTYTPADVVVEANKLQRFTLQMPKHLPLVIEPFTPERGVSGLEKGGDLIPTTPP